MRVLVWGMLAAAQLVALPLSPVRAESRSTTGNDEPIDAVASVDFFIRIPETLTVRMCGTDNSPVRQCQNRGDPAWRQPDRRQQMEVGPDLVIQAIANEGTLSVSAVSHSLEAKSGKNAGPPKQYVFAVP